MAERDAGLASGLVNTTQQVGGALGVAVLSTLAITRSDELIADGTAAPVALTEGFQIALIAAAGFAIAGALAVLALVRGRRRSEPVAEPVAGEPAPERASASTVRLTGAAAGRPARPARRPSPMLSAPRSDSRETTCTRASPGSRG